MPETITVMLPIFQGCPLRDARDRTAIYLAMFLAMGSKTLIPSPTLTPVLDIVTVLPTAAALSTGKNGEHVISIWIANPLLLYLYMCMIRSSAVNFVYDLVCSL